MDFAGGEGPVANGLAVLEDDGPEDAVAAVGAVHVVGLHGQVAEELRPFQRSSISSARMAFRAAAKSAFMAVRWLAR